MTIRHAITRSSVMLRNNYPSLAFGLGIGGMLAGTFLACRATLKLEEVLDDTEKHVELVNQTKAVAEASNSVAYGPREHGKDLAYVYGRAAWKLVKLYGPAVAVGGASLYLLTNSHTTLVRRNRDLALAYAALDRAYQAYRDRFRDEVAPELPRVPDATIEEMLEEVGDSPNRPVGHEYSPYSRIFDECSTVWNPNPLQNRTYIEVTQTWANNTLKSTGVLYLNDVYKQLGMETVPGGQLIGWVWDPVERFEIDFDLYNPNNRRFLEGWEQNVVLDFNVQGLVTTLIKELRLRRHDR